MCANNNLCNIKDRKNYTLFILDKLTDHKQVRQMADKLQAKLISYHR